MLIDLMEQNDFDPTGKFTVISIGGMRERQY